jgi:FkbM family methyltransferase
MPSAPLAEEDRHFRHYSLKHRLVSWVSRTIFDRYSYTVGHGLLRGMKRKGGLGWLPERIAGGTETAEIRFWRTLDLQDQVVYDIGAFEGLLSLFFASRAREVIAYEPNARNQARLRENLALNGIRNVQIRGFGVGKEPQTLEMVWDPSMPGGASIEGPTVENLRATVPSACKQFINITTIDVDRASANLPAPDLIKIDIEGFELEALCGARQTLLACRPALYLEMHGETLREKKRKVAGIVAFLNEAGYSDIRHVETGTQIIPANSVMACEGHLYIPRSS